MTTARGSRLAALDIDSPAYEEVGSDGARSRRRTCWRKGLALGVLVGAAVLLVSIVLLDSQRRDAERAAKEARGREPWPDTPPAHPSTPQQLHLAFGSHNADSMRVVWLTVNGSASIVQYGTSASSLDMTVNGGPPTNYTFKSYTSPHIHSALLPSLSYNTRYYYRVGEPSYFSETYSFVTPPPPAATSALDFAVVGDLGQTKNSAVTVQHMLARSPHTILHVGDLSYADSYEPRWDSYGRMVQPLAATAAWMTAAGNHEIEAWAGHASFMAYNARYPMPSADSGGDQSLWYSFNVGCAHVIVLNSYSNYSVGSPQYRWLQQDLSSYDSSVTPWVIVMLHAPWYNTNAAHQGEGDAMRVAMEPLLNSANVPIVLDGHVHAYERVKSVDNFNLRAGAPQYFNIGDGGNHEGLRTHWLSMTDWSAFREASFGHGYLSIKNTTHAEWTWNRNQDNVATVSDRTWIIRSS